MGDWAEGYMTKVDYVHGYCAELNPQRIPLALLHSGLAVPRITTACELGFGQGLSANLHAAASDVEWYGTDFNPSQAAQAQELALASGSGAKFYDDAFADFANRQDLPDFDYIGLHGIWTWVSDANRHVIVDFIRRKLKVGGVLYVSYNTHPGWSEFFPMRHLLNLHVDMIGAKGNSMDGKIAASLDFATELLATRPAYGAANPAIARRIEKMKEQPAQYLAHEYFNADWHPMPFATMAGWLAPAKVQYACSARYLDNIETVRLTAEQQAFLQKIPDRTLRQSSYDFMVNQQFRQDYWIKGPRYLDNLSRIEALRSQKVMLSSADPEIPSLLQGAQTLIDARKIVELLADLQVKTLGELETAVKPHGLNLSHVLEAVMALAEKNRLHAVQDEFGQGVAAVRSARLNRHLLAQARGSNNLGYLASPLTGGGIAVEQYHQLFLLAMHQGMPTPPEWARFVWDLMSEQGLGIVKNGAALVTAEENLAELTAYANAFSSTRLPILKALGVV